MMTHNGNSVHAHYTTTDIKKYNPTHAVGQTVYCYKTATNYKKIS